MISCPIIKMFFFKAFSDILITRIEADPVCIVLGAPDSISALIRTQRQILSDGLIKKVF